MELVKSPNYLLHVTGSYMSYVHAIPHVRLSYRKKFSGWYTRWTPLLAQLASDKEDSVSKAVFSTSL